MELDNLRKSMKMVLSESRYRHCLGVEEVSYDLALIFQENTLKASIAGLLHDCAKYLTDEELIEKCKKNQISISKIERKLPNQLLHAKVGAIIAREKFGIIDENILNAITYHTTGRPAMTKLEKIVFVADYIEPSRKSIPMLTEIREVAYMDIDQALVMILNRILKYLNNNSSIIDASTMETYRYYIK